MGRFLDRLESWGVWWLIFLIPTNLSLHLFKQSAHIYGITVDYLIPKLYFSDVVIVGLLSLWLLRHLTKVPRWLIQQKVLSSTTILLGLLVLTLVVSAQNSTHPIGAFWFLAKLAEMTWLGFYLSHHLKLQAIKLPLLLTLLFQSGIGILQWIQKQSLFGYWFLGESSLRTTSHIAKTGITGDIRPLPYGTTPHPNVLAGFIAVGLLVLLVLYAPDRSTLNLKQLRQLKVIKKFLRQKQFWIKLVLWILILIPTITTLVLTQSVSAVVVLVLGVTLYVLGSMHWRNTLAMIAIFLALGIGVSPYVESTSITRRVQLLEISWKMFLSDPMLGVGPNNFTARMTDFGRVISTTRFLQPVHNIYVLWVVEAGLIATILIGLILWQTQNSWLPRVKKVSLTRFIPLIAIAVIGLTDHYPLSLQTGQLLSVLAFVLVFGTQKQINKKQIKTAKRATKKS